MHRLTLAYRDDDRTPVIFAIREMAKRHYDLTVNIVRIKGGDAYEAALFNGAADVIIEHLEYLYDEAVKGKKVMFFCAPSKGGGLDLVVRPNIRSVEELRGQDDGRPFARPTARGDVVAENVGLGRRRRHRDRPRQGCRPLGPVEESRQRRVRCHLHVALVFA